MSWAALAAPAQRPLILLVAALLTWPEPLSRNGVQPPRRPGLLMALAGSCSHHWAFLIAASEAPHLTPASAVMAATVALALAEVVVVAERQEEKAAMAGPAW